MEIKTEIAKTQFNFAGSLDLAQVSKTLQLKASVEGDRLDSLNGLLDLDLPPLKSYRACAQLTLQKNRAELSDFVIQVGKSKLVGKMTVNKSGVRPEAVIDLSAPLIQLNDFDVGDWSPQKSDSEKPAHQKDPKKEKVTKAAQDQKSSADGGVDGLKSPEVLARFNVRMNVKAEKVMSGTDELGSGVLTATRRTVGFHWIP